MAGLDPAIPRAVGFGAVATVRRPITSGALKAAIGALVKDQRTARDFLARNHLAQDDVVIAGLVHAGDATAHLARGALQQRKPVWAEGEREIVEPVSRLLVREAGGQLGLMLAEDIHG